MGEARRRRTVAPPSNGARPLPDALFKRLELPKGPPPDPEAVRPDFTGVLHMLTWPKTEKGRKAITDEIERRLVMPDRASLQRAGQQPQDGQVTCIWINPDHAWRIDVEAIYAIRRRLPDCPAILVKILAEDDGCLFDLVRLPPDIARMAGEVQAEAMVSMECDHLESVTI